VPQRPWLPDSLLAWLHTPLGAIWLLVAALVLWRLSQNSPRRRWCGSPVGHDNRFQTAVILRLDAIEQKVDKIMSALDDLHAIVASISTDVQAIIAKLSQSGGVSAADVEAVVTQLQGVDQALQGALNPPPPPTTV